MAYFKEGKMALKKRKAKSRKPAKKKATRKKIVKRKPVSRKKALKKKVAPKKKTRARSKNKDVIGTVTHYFPKVRAAVIKLKVPFSVGQAVKIKGHTTDFTQTITSMQIDHVSVTTAKKGQEIGLLVDSRVRQHDLVYKV